jgi:hypothetical protein
VNDFNFQILDGFFPVHPCRYCDLNYGLCREGRRCNHYDTGSLLLWHERIFFIVRMYRPNKLIGQPIQDVLQAIQQFGARSRVLPRSDRLGGPVRSGTSHTLFTAKYVFTPLTFTPSIQRPSGSFATRSMCATVAAPYIYCMLSFAAQEMHRSV